MMTNEERIAKAREVNRRLRTEREAIPKFIAESMTLANGDAAKGQEVTNIIAQVASTLPVRPWAAGMITQPGDLVSAPSTGRVFAYSGAAAMTHANPLFFPGSTGVYYWAILPNTKDGIPIYPDISGIVVAVRRDQVWCNPAGTKKYRWNAADTASCSWYPGQAGAHQWVEVAS